jgi:predicted pyridoxine 5'-phosphate oxidase superfamily flavin-nucleotide-binding protein
MAISTTIADAIDNAEARALATNGPHGINVVPISMAKVNTDSIWLFDFFMNKTVNNVQANPEVALSAWTGLTGVQVKATASYVTEGPEFEEAVAWVHEQNPDRVTKGLLILTPTEILDVSPGGAFTPDELAID